MNSLCKSVSFLTACLALHYGSSDLLQSAVCAEAKSGGDAFKVKLDAARGGVARLAQNQPGAFDFLMDGQVLGDVETRVRTGNVPWRENHTAASADVRQAVLSPDGRRLTVTYARPSRHALGVRDLAIVEEFDRTADALTWTIRLENRGEGPLEVGDLALPLRMNTSYTWNKEETFLRRLYRHQFISGHGSFLFWQPVGGRGPHLVMIPTASTKLEFFTETASDYAHGGGRFTAFVHSAATGPSLPGTWRQPHTSVTLARGQSATYRFAFHWADDLQGVREVLFRNGGFDIWIVPGMVVPRDLDAMFALRTRNHLLGVDAEFPDTTRIEPASTQAADTRVFRVKFSRLGENRLAVRYGSRQVMHLEFFVTEPLETLIKKRAAFIAAKQQHRDPSKWYNGLFSLWDTRLPAGKNLLGPENRAGQHLYAVSGSDDPSNSKCIYLSEKNVAYPEAEEIAALEYFLEHFVWGKHQRTDAEQPYPYGIYGADSWQENRFANRDPLHLGISRPGGPSACRMWRTFDYTTYFALYYNLYRIAKQDPRRVKLLDAKGCLERAFGTAKAFFEVPANIRMEGGWSFTGWVYWAYTVGNFHEKYLLGIIDSLEREGEKEKAAYLRGQWEKKVKYFLYDDPYPWVSEMPVDSTAFESTYAIAKYALSNSLQPDQRLWHDKNRDRWFSHPAIAPAKHQDFLQRQLAANLACRGTIEPAYHTLGSDFRGCGQGFYMLSYMSQMGGWAVLDQALRFEDATNSHALLRLGYASLLSSWALVNSGPAESRHGYWYPGPLHDGAAGWGFTSQKRADEWCPAVRGQPRGPWPVDGEIDHGLTAGVEAACTVLVDDPIFGRFAYGGSLTESGDDLQIVPRDGVRQRFHALLGAARLHLALDRDGFAREEPLVVDPALTRVRFLVENRGGEAHAACLTISGLPAGKYRLLVDGKPVAAFESRQTTKSALAIPMETARLCHVEIGPDSH